MAPNRRISTEESRLMFGFAYCVLQGSENPAKGASFWVPLLFSFVADASIPTAHMKQSQEREKEKAMEKQREQEEKARRVSFTC